VNIKQNNLICPLGFNDTDQHRVAGSPGAIPGNAETIYLICSYFPTKGCNGSITYDQIFFALRGLLDSFDPVPGAEKTRAGHHDGR
jgi:hypothetical protein